MDRMLQTGNVHVPRDNFLRWKTKEQAPTQAN